MIELGDIENAQQTISGRVHRTPTVSSLTLGRKMGMHLHFKAELFQKTGSFKPRGAINKLCSLTPEERKRGVITLSSGNHAQGLAYAASLFGIPTTVVMPSYSFKSKIDAAKGFGAEVIITDDDLLKTCLQIQKERNSVLVHPFDDPYIVAGQGTIGIEILEDTPEVDVVIVAVGGGGLISGIAAAVKMKKPDVKIVGVEPVGACAMWQSLQQDRPVHLESVDTIADGLAAPFAGEINFQLVKKYVDDLVLVSDEEIIEPLCLILERAKLLTEPAGAVPFAALFQNKVHVPRGSEVVCVLSGGNLDRGRLARFLTHA
ncbi:MAG: pyridoxal-phosphate dependent enzyme [Candidatus Aminicenantes bacterium]|nr:pyridoxal-phosphate dependent enzyme [Candidatus Aminicenantes bacterium]